MLDLAAEAPSLLDSVARLTDAVGSRRTTPARLRQALSGRSRIARRAFLAGVLDDAAAGTCSVLEHGYLTRVERPHRLPRGERQLVALGPSGRVLRDVAHRRQRLVVELDGRAFHTGAARRDADLEHDLLAALDGDLTVRLGWGQVFDRPCATALHVGGLLRRRGWQGRPATCPACP